VEGVSWFGSRFTFTLHGHIASALMDDLLIN
jgi:hypothetical protein